jgi:hypothetical protein
VLVVPATAVTAVGVAVFSVLLGSDLYTKYYNMSM